MLKVTVLLHHPQYTKLQLAGSPLDIIQEDISVNMGIVFHLNDGKCTKSWGSKASPYHDTLFVSCIINRAENSFQTIQLCSFSLQNIFSIELRISKVLFGKPWAFNMFYWMFIYFFYVALNKDDLYVWQICFCQLSWIGWRSNQHISVTTGCFQGDSNSYMIRPMVFYYTLRLAKLKEKKRCLSQWHICGGCNYDWKSLFNIGIASEKYPTLWQVHISHFLLTCLS